MKQIKTSIRNIKISKLTINPFLSKYGIQKLSAFEIQELNRFDIPVGQVLATEDNSVLFNWDAVEEASKRGMKEIAITVIEGIDADESIQVISLKNMRRKLSRYQQAELIVELRDYLDNNPVAQPWKADIPGDSVLKKVAFLIGYSYGMTTQLQRIYKYRPELLQKIDEGEMTFVQALQLVSGSSQPKGSDVDASDDEPVTDDDVETGAGSEDIETEAFIDVQTGTGQTGSKQFAGERNMVPCENIAGIRIVYASGKVIEFDISDGKGKGTIVGEPTKEMHYSGQFHPTDNTEFHVLSTDRDRTSLQLIISNADKIAA